MTVKKKKKRANVSGIPNYDKMHEHRQNIADLNMPLDFDRLEQAFKDPHRTYPTAHSLLSAFVKYLQYCREFKRSPNISGFAIYDGVSDGAVEWAMKLDGYEFVSDYIKTAFKDIYINKMFSDWNPIASQRFLDVALNWNPKDKKTSQTNILIYNNMSESDVEKKLLEIRKQIAVEEDGADVVTLDTSDYSID